MTRHLLAGAAVLLTTAAAWAQPGPPYQSQPYPAPYSAPYSSPGAAPLVMPNIYNPRTQPLSPYLNLLRGGNTATNYYYGVRPGTLGGAGGGSLGAPFTAGGGNRTLFFPQLASSPDPLQPLDVPGPGDVLAPAGHAVVFNNTMGYFPSPFGNRGGSRPGLAGIGTSRPPAPKK